MVLKSCLKSESRQISSNIKFEKSVKIVEFDEYTLQIPYTINLKSEKTINLEKNYTLFTKNFIDKIKAKQYTNQELEQILMKWINKNCLFKKKLKPCNDYFKTLSVIKKLYETNSIDTRICDKLLIHYMYCINNIKTIVDSTFNTIIIESKTFYNSKIN